MCGLSGIVGPANIDIDTHLARMVGTQRHRGPDGDGRCVADFGAGRIGLGHNRLAIIDLSPSGAQPMRDPASGSVLIYNGELYNYRQLKRELVSAGFGFKGTSDTEVLLKALVHWGPDCMRRFEGMYAFAFVRPDRGLILARDPLGIKPLFWTPTEKCLVFGSEVRALLASGLVSDDLDTESLTGLFAYGAFEQPESAFRSIQAFPAGCWVEVSPSREQVWKAAAPRRHWSFPPARDVAPGEAIELTRDVVTRAVVKHLVSDVPVGVFLSSGIDSSIVAQIAAQNADCAAVTVGFDDNSDYSELALARKTAAAIGVRHETLNVGTDDALSWTREWLSTIDQPGLDGLNVFMVAKAAHRRGLKVALSGQGGDEVFGGYPSFGDVPRMQRIVKATSVLPRPALHLLIASLGGLVSGPQRRKLNDIVGGPVDLRSLYLQRRRLMSDGEIGALGLPPPAVSGDGGSPDDGVDDAVRQISALELTHYLGNTLLHIGDLASMANSLEVRVPMLDLDVLNAILPLKGKIRLPSGRPDKHLLRQAFGHRLPQPLLRQRKRGFTLPLSRWMRTSLRESCEAALQNARNSGLLEPNGVQQIWQAYLREPESSAWSRAWLLCVFGAWLGHTADGGRARSRTKAEPICAA